MSKGLHCEYVLISNDELCGKYSHTMHQRGKNYAKESNKRSAKRR